MKLFLLLAVPALATATALLGADHPCWDETNRLKEEVAGPDGSLPPGGVYPNCDRLGRYSPQQCRGSQCFCVDGDGNSLSHSDHGDYTTNIWEGDEQKCECARAEAESQSVGIGGPRLQCTKTGDYHHTQCTGSICRCVHKHSGQTLGETWHVADYAQEEAKCAKL